MKWGAGKVLWKAFICIIPPLQLKLLLHKGRTCLNPHIHVVLLFELERQVKLDSHDGLWNLKRPSHGWFLLVTWLMPHCVSWQSNFTSQKLTKNRVILNGCSRSRFVSSSKNFLTDNIFLGVQMMSCLSCLPSKHWRLSMYSYFPPMLCPPLLRYIKLC